MGDPRDFRNFVGAVIDKRAHEKIGEYVSEREQREDHRRRQVDGKNGFFISPTLVEAEGPGVSPALRGDLWPRGDGVLATTTRSGTRRSRSSTARRPTR